MRKTSEILEVLMKQYAEARKNGTKTEFVILSVMKAQRITRSTAYEWLREAKRKIGLNRTRKGVAPSS